MTAYWKVFKELWHANNFYIVCKITESHKAAILEGAYYTFHSSFKIVINPFLLWNSKCLFLIDENFAHVVIIPNLSFTTNLRSLHLKQAYVQDYELLLRAVLHFPKQFVVSRRMPKTQGSHPKNCLKVENEQHVLIL